MLKYKTILFVAFCGCSVSQLHSQYLQPCALGTIQWGQPISEAPNYEPIRLIGVDKFSRSSFWQSRKADNTLIERFDEHNNREFSVVVSPLDLEGAGGFQQAAFGGMVKLKNSIAFFPISTRRGKQGSLFACVLGLDGSVLIDTQWICDGANALNFHAVPSTDSTHFYLVGTEAGTNGLQKISVRMYDESLHPIFSKEILPDQDFDQTDFIFTNEVIVDNRNIIHISREHSGRHSVLSIDPATGDVQDFCPDLKVRLYDLTRTSDGTALIYGFCDSDSIKNGNQFYGVWNTATRKFDISRFRRVPMRQFSRHNFVALNCIPRKDGGRFLISEEESGSISALKEGDIDILNLSATGEVIYTVTLPKKQVSLFLSKLNHVSYIPYYLKNQKTLALLYNMKPKSVAQLNMSGVDPAVQHQKSIPIVTLIDNSGKINTLPLFNDVNNITIYNLNATAGGNKFIVGRKNKQYAIGRLLIQ